MRKILIILFTLGAFSSQADTLTIRQCIRLALKAHPLDQQKALNSEIEQARLGMNSNMLYPDINISGQLSYQSDVVNFPDNPLIALDIPKTQSRVYMELQQVLYNGGISGKKTQLDKTEREVRDLETDVQLQKTSEVVVNLYFGILLTERRLQLLQSALQELHRHREAIESGIRNGVMLPSSADRFDLRIIETESEIASVEYDKKELHDMLSSWTGVETGSMDLEMPSELTGSEYLFNPELQLMQARIRQIERSIDLERTSRQPKIGLFLQGGFGSPNPLNFFETGFEPFYIGGLRATWKPFDYGNTSSRVKIAELQAEGVRKQYKFAENMINREVKSYMWESGKLDQLSQKDVQAVSLQERILSVAESQHKNGVLSTADYLAEMDKLNRLRLQAEIHIIKKCKTSWDEAVISGNIDEL